MLVSPSTSSTSVNGTSLPTCDPSTQPALAPNFAQLDVTIAPGSSKDVDSYLCTRGTTVASSNFDIALSVDLTGKICRAGAGMPKHVYEELSQRDMNCRWQGSFWRSALP